MLTPSRSQHDRGGWQRRRFGAPQKGAEPTGAGLTPGGTGLSKPFALGPGRSRALDYLATLPGVDASQVGIAGVSRYGNAALVTMAFDQRFAMGLTGSSGTGGTTLHRRNFGESLENLAGTGECHWMAGNYLNSYPTPTLL